MTYQYLKFICLISSLKYCFIFVNDPCAFFSYRHSCKSCFSGIYCGPYYIVALEYCLSLGSKQTFSTPPVFGVCKYRKSSKQRLIADINCLVGDVTGCKQIAFNQNMSSNSKLWNPYHTLNIPYHVAYEYICTCFPHVQYPCYIE